MFQVKAIVLKRYVITAAIIVSGSGKTALF
jgi:hypothetical protein